MTSDFLVVGAGVAGLRAAIELAEAGDVLVMAKDSLRESSSEYAQGGIAVALSDDDEVELHEQDTLAAGAELCNPQAVHTLVEEGPAAEVFNAPKSAYTRALFAAAFNLDISTEDVVAQ